MYPLKNLRRRSARTVLTVAGVSLAITLAIIMFSISEGISESSNEIIEKSGIDIIVTPKGGDILIGSSQFDDVRNMTKAMEGNNSQIKSAFPYLREKVYITANKTNPKTNRPVITSILAKGANREVSEAFTTSKLILGTQLPTYGDPFFAERFTGANASSSSFTHEILLNSILAEYLDVNPGDKVFISDLLPVSASEYETWLENTTYFTVKGIVTQSFEDEGEMSCTMHASELQFLTDNLLNDTADTILIDLYEPSDADMVKRWLERDYMGLYVFSLPPEYGQHLKVGVLDTELKQAFHENKIYLTSNAEISKIDENDWRITDGTKQYRVEDDGAQLNIYKDSNEISAFTQEDIKEEIELFTSIYRGFSDMVAGITLVVALLFISTVIMISVKERTPELSALRAIGFSRGSIFKLVLAESMLICIIGFTIGLILGTLGTGVVNAYAETVGTGLPEGFELARITLDLMVRATGAILIIGLIVGLLPALWASRLNISLALKSE